MKIKITFVVVAFSCMLWTSRATAQSNEVTQLLLNVEKLTQFKQILSDMKKGYQILSKATTPSGIFPRGILRCTRSFWMS